MQVYFPGHIAGRGELRCRDYPEGPNWHLCLQASFLPTALQRATMMKCVTYTSGQATPLLKTCQELLISLRVNLITQAWHLHLPPTPTHLFSFLSLHLHVKSDWIFMWSLTYCLSDVSEDEFSESARTFPAEPHPLLWKISWSPYELGDALCMLHKATTSGDQPLEFESQLPVFRLCVSGPAF